MNKRSLQFALVLGGLMAVAHAQQWSVVPPAGGPRPLARDQHVMAHDLLRRRTLLYGGYDGTFSGFDDHREWDGVQWIGRSLSPRPPLRWAHGMAFDVARGRTTLFGGYMASFGPNNDTWEFDGTAWTERLPAHSPSLRFGASMVYDSWRHKIVLFGGIDTNLMPLADTWEWDSTDWVQVGVASAPPPRTNASMAFDDERGQVVLFGGEANGAALGDTWIFVGGAWVQSAPATSPAPRAQAAMAYDSDAGHMMLFGGRDAAATQIHGDTWLWDGANWTQAPIQGLSPRYGSSLVYDARRAEMLSFGGRGAGGFLADLAILPTTGRREMSVVAPPLLGATSQFRYSYPAPAVGRFAAMAFAGRQLTGQPTAIPGYVSLGEPRIDLGQLFAQFSAMLGPSGALSISIPIPADPTLAGLQFDVQALDLDVPTSVIHWARDDAEVEVQGSSPPVEFDMAPIPAGSFAMGSSWANLNEQPVHGVTLSQPFWIGRTEVTQAQWRAVMGNNPAVFQAPNHPDEDRRPVENVSWTDAMAFCAALNAIEAAAGRVPAGYQYRLPTEAEWEYSCRAGTTTEWNTGPNLSCGQANFGGCLADAQNPNGQPWLVARYRPNAFGLFDMHGGLWEWCLDSWDGSVNYPSFPVTDPFNTIGASRVHRSGSYYSNITAQFCRSAQRGAALPSARNGRLGFRVALGPALVP